MDEPIRRARLERAFLQHAQALLRYLERRGLSAAEADDIVADVFVVAWKRLGEVPQEEELPWLFGVVRKIWSNHRRGDSRRIALKRRLCRRVQERQKAESPSAAERYDERARLARLAEAFVSLQEADREVLMLVVWEGLTSREAAYVLGCGESAFRMRLLRARQRLREALERTDDVPPARTGEEVEDET